jgi:RNA polymerase sigma-70 factor (ECF subfamily)
MTASTSELEQHRTALVGHCYRMLGSNMDADDAVQETMVRAWKSFDSFDGRSSVRTWLYRIATNVCLDAIADKKRRSRPVDDGPVGTVHDELETRERTHWIEPIADARAIPGDEDPARQLELRESIRLAFVAALQHLPAKQRAALLMTDVLGLSAAEVAEAIDTSVASVNSALQRARATLSSRPPASTPAALSAPQADLVARYCEAFERYDVDTLTSLFHEDATLSMPPFTLWLQGHEAISKWLLGPGAPCRGSRLIATNASGMPAFAQYRPSEGGGHHAWALCVLEVKGDRFASLVSFLDVETLFPRFGLPMRLD